MSGWKRALSLLLCGALALAALAACGPNGDGEGNVTYGRYVETDITPPEFEGYLGTFAAFPGGVLNAISSKDNYDEASDRYLPPTYTHLRSTDNGASWQSLDMAWADEYLQSMYQERDFSGTDPVIEDVYLGQMVPLEDGALLVTIQHSTQTLIAGDAAVGDPMDGKGAAYEYQNRVELLKISPTGEKAPYAIPEMEQRMAESPRGGSIGMLRALPGGRLLVQYYIEMPDPQNPEWTTSENHAGVFDIATGEKLYEFSGEYDLWSSYSNDTTLFIRDYMANSLKAINISDGSPSTAPMPSEEHMQRLMNNYSGNNTFVDNNNNFYTVSPRGMYKFPAQAGGQGPASPASSGGAPASSASSGGAPAPRGQSAPEGDESQPEQVMDGLNYTFGSPLYNMSSMTFNPEDESILMAVQEYDRITGESKSSLLRYVWDDNAIATSDETIRVYSLYDNQSVRLALSEYKRLHPEVFVQYEVAFPMDETGMMPAMNMPAMSVGAGGMGGGGDTGMTEEDALRALNTELLNGTGPDVIVLDGLPVESFIARGVLVDLAPIVSANDDLFAPVFEPMKQDGKIYAVPTNFFVPTLFGEAGYVEQFQSLDALISAIEAGAGIPAQMQPQDDWTQEEWDAYYAEMYNPRPAEEQPLLYFESLEDLTATLYATCAPAIFSEKGGINQENLTTFMEAVKRISDKYGLANPDSMGFSSGGFAVTSMGGYYSYSYSPTLNRYGQRQARLGYSRMGGIGTLQEVSNNLYYSTNMGRGLIVVDDLGNPVEADTDGSQAPPEANPAAISAPGLSSGVYFPTQMVGVTSISKKPELAKEFVTTMLGGDVQKNDMGNGFPVSRTAFANMYAGYLEMGERYRDMDGNGPAMMTYDYEAMIGGLTTPFYVNDYVRAAITEPIAGYCAGSASLEQVVQKIVDETELYFAERQ